MMKLKTLELLAILLVLLIPILYGACGAKNSKEEMRLHFDNTVNDNKVKEISLLDTIKCRTTLDSILHREVYSYVPLMPEFPGGTEAMYKYLYQNLKFVMPKDSFQGSVIVTFIVEPDGSIKDAYAPRPYFKNGLSSLEKQLIKVVKDMPKWNPGKCNDKIVPAQFTLPIHF